MVSRTDQQNPQTDKGVPDKSRTISWWIRRVLVGLLVLLIVLVLVSIAYQTVAAEIDERRYPPPGEMIEVGDHRLHINVTGEAAGGPTVVLEAGATSASPQWAWIQPEVSEFARVVSYDRSGAGWSEGPANPKDVRHNARELHAALEEAGIQGPYVLVGHSFGGMNTRMFAEMYPTEVAGMVLIDPNDPKLMERLTEEELERVQGFVRMSKALPILARFGVLRLYNPLAGASEGLPPRQQAELEALSSSVGHLEAARTDLAQSNVPMSETYRQLRRLEDGSDFSDTPLVVINRGTPMGASDVSVTRATQQAGAELAALSSEVSHRIVADADHFSLVMDREHAEETVDAIRNIVE